MDTETFQMLAWFTLFFGGWGFFFVLWVLLELQERRKTKRNRNIW